jgi:hypothetical protein
MISTLLLAATIGNTDCVQTVCFLDPYCCEVEWDIFCDVEKNTFCSCSADLSFDGKVDGLDLGIVLGDWATAFPRSDLNLDNIVDGADIALLLSQWGKCE